MEHLVSRWNDRDIYGAVVRCQGKQVVLFDAADLLQPFVPTSMSLQEIRERLQLFQQNKILTSYNDHTRLVTLQSFLCFVLPAYLGISNLFDIEKLTLQEWIRLHMNECTTPEIDRQWMAPEPQKRDPCLDAEKSLFEAQVLPRTLLDYDKFLFDVSATEVRPDLLYKPSVLQAHFQDQASFNTIASFVLLSDYVSFGNENAVENLWHLGRYRQPGKLHAVCKPDEAYAGRNDALAFFNSLYLSGHRSEFFNVVENLITLKSKRAVELMKVHENTVKIWQLRVYNC